ncbi:MAG: DNA polymerase III subunit delta [Sorangiineae bacterium]|nr:DNA polymerase III subunit delta [Sorangiineae bacterium]
MTPDEALTEARARELRPVYLVIGEEQYLASMVLGALREAALTSGGRGTSEDRFTAGDDPVEAVVDAARTLPMFARQRLVVVRALERWEPKGDADSKRKTDPFERLLDYAKEPSTSTVLLLTAGKLDKRRRLVTTARSDGWLVDCAPLGRGELPRFIERQAAARGHRLAHGVADLIAELAGPELAPVADALERSCLYAGANAEVTEEVVAECVVRVRPTTVWELVDAVGRRDAGAALATLERVYDPQDRGLRLVGLLAWSARQLIRFESATRSGLAPPEAAKAAGAPPFKARDLAEQTRRIPRHDLERWLERLARVDLALKGGSKRLPKAVLEHALLELCGGARARGGPPHAPRAHRS